MGAKYDFGGWATVNDLKCSDGRTIRKDAFIDCDGRTVPLVWQHQHMSPSNVLGHALLENRDEGVYCYCSFNGSTAGKDAKEAVRHGDVKSLSIYANRLQQHGGDVIHGMIREVSLVLTGANPGAIIDNPVVAHADGEFDEVEDEATICMYRPLEFMHADEEEEKPKESDKKSDDEDDDDETIEDVFNTFTDEQKNVAYYLIGKAAESPKKAMAHADADADDDEDDDTDGKTVGDVVNSLSEKQKQVLYYLVGKAAEDAGAEDEEDEEDDNDEVEHSYEGGDSTMRRNVFEADEMNEDSNYLTHAEMETIINDAKRYGSMKDSFLAHAEEYGIQDIDWLFPDVKNLNNPPEFIKRKDDWVAKVMSRVHHTPFSRIKSTFADITEDEARARGYMKGKLKKEEVFSLLKRTTTPTTVYKKQKLDRDDVIDITDFDVVAWLKAEMRMMLDEELARAYVFGDGRLASSDDKINETNIRPIISDSDLFTVKTEVEFEQNATDDDKTKAIIRAVIKSRKNYRGSGTPDLFIGEDLLSDMLLLEDGFGHSLYKTEAELATKLRVKEIIPVPDELIPTGVFCVYVNLNDYNVGADRGGAVSMFDDFDIDYNQQKYLIETRCSGALIKPYSAVVIREKSN